MNALAPEVLTGHVIVADGDPAVVTFVMQTLRNDGHTVFHASDGLSAVELAFALDRCHLVISNTNVDGVAGLELVRQLRHQQPTLPILYLATVEGSTPDIESRLPPNVPILREPFTADALRAVVGALLKVQADGGREG
jgi:DNA-binding response OmpR family regulator